MKYILRLLIVAQCGLYGLKVQAQINIHTEDLPRFYQAFDSVFNTKDSLKQIQFFKRLYEDKASNGLKKFMELRGGNAVAWRKMALKDSAMLSKKRPWILSVLKQEKIIAQRIEQFKKIYPDFREGDIYFCVGVNNSGGTVYDNTVYIGTEVLSSEADDWAVFTVLHEFVHTQQWVQRNMTKLMGSDSVLNGYLKTHKQLLGKCLEEGVADFVAELAFGKSLVQTNPKGHTAFGVKHEKQIWELFKQDMFKDFDDTNGWLYSKKAIGKDTISDLGYFMGYQIAKTYYRNSKNKTLAIKQMIEKGFTDESAKLFLKESGYLRRTGIMVP